VTLLELLLVMAILALVFGAGAGLFASTELQGATAPGLVRSALRSAQSAAQLERLPTALWVDRTARTLELRTPRTLGTWQFEAPRAGRDDPAAELRGRAIGGATLDAAYVGAGLDFLGEERESSYVLPLQDSGEFDLREGLALSIALEPGDALDGNVWRLGTVAGLEYTRGGGLSAWVVPAAADDPTGRRHAARVDVSAPSASLPMDRWSVVELVYDRVELQLRIDGFPAGLVPLEDPLPVLDGPLVLGGRPRAFPGALDQLVVRVYERSEPLVLPETVGWPAGAPLRVRFEADGTLDRVRHPDGLVLRFEPVPGRLEEVWVSTYGTVD
jgi:type II secretory pathway pseudopilin PulG